MARLALLCAVVGLGAGGCSSWKPMAGPVSPDMISALSKRPLRVLLADGRKMEIEKAHVIGDSLHGQVRRGPKSEATYTPTAIALADIDSIETDQMELGKTILFIVLLGGIIVLIVATTGLSSIGIY